MGPQIRFTFGAICFSVFLAGFGLSTRSVASLNESCGSPNKRTHKFLVSMFVTESSKRIPRELVSSSLKPIPNLVIKLGMPSYDNLSFLAVGEPTTVYSWQPLADACT